MKKSVKKSRRPSTNWGQRFTKALNRGIQESIKDDGDDPTMRSLRDLATEELKAQRTKRKGKKGLSWKGWGKKRGDVKAAIIGI
ncbi:MAG: hypothetical protein WCV85_05100 [Patescibacteria group bacterium]|jgi:hypothetical protein